MIKIGLISDTHAYLDPAVGDYFKEVDEIWHAGDIGNMSVVESLRTIKPLKAVYGNIDGHEIRQVFPEDLWWEAEGLSIWMTHIGGYPGRYTNRIRQVLKVRRPDIFICGHSHILRVMKDPDFSFYAMNPGAAGREGFHSIRTILTFTLADKKIKDLQAIELGKR
jgi:putative phosphoesterase